MKRTLVLFVVSVLLLTACGNLRQKQPVSTAVFSPTITPSPGPTSTPTRTATPEKARLEDLVIPRDQLGDLVERFQRVPYFEQGIAPNESLGIAESLIATFINLKNAGNISIYITRCLDHATAQSMIVVAISLLQGEQIEHSIAQGLPEDATIFTTGGKTGILFTYQELLLGVVMDDTLVESSEDRITLVQEIAIHQLEKVKGLW